MGTFASNPRFVAFIAFVLAHETEHNRDGSVRTERDADDPGGTTKYGIDQRSHPRVDIAALTEEAAKEIYFAEWTKAPCDELPCPLGEMTFDVFVNGGPAVKWIQEALNNVHAAGLKVDGFCGPKTLRAACDAAWNSDRLREVAAVLYQLRQARYERLAEERPKMKKYLKGWSNRSRNLRDWAFARIAA